LSAPISDHWMEIEGPRGESPDLKKFFALPYLILTYVPRSRTCRRPPASILASITDPLLSPSSWCPTSIQPLCHHLCFTLLPLTSSTSGSTLLRRSQGETKWRSPRLPKPPRLVWLTGRRLIHRPLPTLFVSLKPRPLPVKPPASGMGLNDALS
jgi:hypothetical protein